MLAGAEPGGPDRPDRRRHRAHPGRQRRRDAAALQPAEGRRDVQHARAACYPRAHRPRHRPRARHRPADDVRAAARPPADRARRLPRAARRAARLLRGRPPRRPPVRAPRRRCPGGPERPTSWLLGSSPQSAIWAGELGLPYSFADFINPTAPRSPPLPRAVPAVAAARRARASRSASRRSAPTPTRRRSASRPAADGDLDAAPRPADRGPAGRKALRFLEPRGRREPAAAAARRRHARRSCAPGSRRSPHEYGADEVIVVTITYDHARAAPLVRADRRGVSPGARALTARRPRPVRQRVADRRRRIPARRRIGSQRLPCPRPRRPE